MTCPTSLEGEGVMKWKAHKMIVLIDGQMAMLSATWSDEADEGWEDIFLDGVGGEVFDALDLVENWEKVQSTLDIMEDERVNSETLRLRR